MISRIRAGSSPAFQNVCHCPRRLVDQVAGTGLDDVVAEQRAHPALDNEAVLVLARVPVQRRDQRPRRDRVLDERETSAGLLAPGHEAHACGADVDELPVRAAELPWSLA